MATPKLDYSPLPTGGGVRLGVYSSDTNVVLSRATSGSGGLSTFTTLYSGATIPLYVDVGDLLPAPLDPTLQYVYELQDAFGTFQTPALSVGGTLTVEQDGLTALLIRLLDAGISALELPASFSRATVMHAMPINGNPPLPLISVNLDLLQQTEVPIGQQVAVTNGSGAWTLTQQVLRKYNITAMTTTANEREFYRDAILGIFSVALADPLSYMGQNVTHHFQAYSSQVVGGGGGATSPGFYFCEMSLELTGNFNLDIVKQYQSFDSTTVPVSQVVSGTATLNVTNIVGAPVVTDTVFVSGT